MFALPANSKSIADIAARIEPNELLRSIVVMNLKREGRERPDWDDDDSRWRIALAELRISGYLTNEMLELFSDGD